MKLIDLEHPGFKPLWVRVSVVAVLIVWTAFEFSRGSVMWGIFFGGLCVICGWRFATIDYSALDDEGE